MIDYFQAVKDRLSMEDVARHYGFEPNRSGFICCPFHHEKTGSLKLYPSNYHCFGCGASGSVIDFVMQLFGLEPRQALERLNADFLLGFPLQNAPTKQEQAAIQKRNETRRRFEEFEKWRCPAIAKLNAAIRVGNTAVNKLEADEGLEGEALNVLTEAETLAIKWRETFEFWADILTHGTIDEQIEIYRDWGNIEGCLKKIG